MTSITCGKCKETHRSVALVRACYRGPRPDASDAMAPVAAPVTASDMPARISLDLVNVREIPASRYAIETESGPAFYEVRVGRPGKWAGYRFLDRLVGAPGDFHKIPVKGFARIEVLAEILADRFVDVAALGQEEEETDGEVPVLTGARAGAVRFSRHFTRCAACLSPLTDPVSRAMGLGPVCATRF